MINLFFVKKKINPRLNASIRQLYDTSNWLRTSF
jgi:hypothetical protein